MNQTEKILIDKAESINAMPSIVASSTAIEAMQTACIKFAEWTSIEEWQVVVGESEKWWKWESYRDSIKKFKTTLELFEIFNKTEVI